MPAALLKMDSFIGFFKGNSRSNRKFIERLVLFSATLRLIFSTDISQHSYFSAADRKNKKNYLRKLKPANRLRVPKVKL